MRKSKISSSFFSFPPETLLHATWKTAAVTHFLSEEVKPCVQCKDQSATALGASSVLGPVR